jgi:hypothetical protein
MTARADATCAGLIPIVVGITGHRDLRDADVPLLEASVRSISGSSIPAVRWSW